MPITPDTLADLTRTVLLAGFGLGLLLGVLAQHSRFCTMGAVSDAVLMGDFARARMWALAAGVAVLGFQGLALTGGPGVADSYYGGPRLNLLSLLTGGLMFGAGMVLASGCAGKNLMRAGTGNLKSLVVLGVIGLSGFATLKGITAVARVRWLDPVGLQLPVAQDLPSLAAALTHLPLAVLSPTLAGVVGLGLIGAALRGGHERGPGWWWGGLGVGALAVLAWWVSGRLGFVAEHPDTLEPAYLASASRRAEGLSFVAATAYGLDYLLFFSDRAKTATLGMVTAAGTLLGATGHALATRSFRWEGFRTTDDLARHLLGGVLMGVGGVTALGCSLGQGLTGVSTLSLGSFIALAATVAGAVLALKWQERPSG